MPEFKWKTPLYKKGRPHMVQRQMQLTFKQNYNPRNLISGSYAEKLPA